MGKPEDPQPPTVVEPTRSRDTVDPAARAALEEPPRVALGSDPDGWPTLRKSGGQRVVPAEVSVPDLPAADVDALAFSARYEQRALLGEGGMGRVTLCQDRRIGRLVAVKMLRKDRSDRPELRMRFLREARVQGQIQHPSVVPVYDVGLGPDGMYFFTMKCVRGRTLDHVLRALRAGEDETAAAFSRHKLLTVFQSVCQAIAFAHEHGVIHRDLKPSNVMIGDFGQVQVLDWGLAKVLETEDLHADEGTSGLTEDAHTLSGEMLGTPGYMSPEQAMGELERIDARTDVYALGAILFELLTLTPLHPRDSVEETLLSTIHGVDARPDERVPGAHAPPELSAICVKSTQLAPEDRHASAKEMLAAIEGFLAGDRDMELRRAIADAHAKSAEEAASRAGDEPSERERAMREASAALAIVPGHEAAMTTLLSLLADRPKRVPPEAKEELREFQQRCEGEARRGMLVAYLGWILYAPLLMWLGPHNHVAGWVAFAPLAVAGFLAYLMYRGDQRPWIPMAMFVAGSTAIATSATITGWAAPLPGIAAAHTVSFVMYTQRRTRGASIAIGLAAILLPFALETSGLIPSSYTFEEGRLTISPVMVQFHPFALRVYLLLSSLGVVLLPSLVLGRYRVALEKTEEEAFLHAWNVRHLLPGEARKAASMLQRSAKRAAAGQYGAPPTTGATAKKAA